jgi:hypothetical protein
MQAPNPDVPPAEAVGAQRTDATNPNPPRTP